MRRGGSFSADLTVEELGRLNAIWLDLTVEFDYYPGEPMVMYYSDGSGYPGSPAMAEFTGFKVQRYGNGQFEVKREERPEWFELLDLIARRKVLDREDHWVDHVLSELDERSGPDPDLEPDIPDHDFERDWQACE